MSVNRRGWRQEKGSVLLFALIMMGVIAALTQQLIKNVSVGIAFSKAMIYREQSELLALGGIRIAQVQLLQAYNKENKKEKSKLQAESAFSFEHFIKKMLPLLNRWQEFQLVEQYDMVEGRIALFISCEEGKLPLSYLYDEKKQALFPGVSSLLKRHKQGTKVPEGALAQSFLQFYKKQKYKVTDATELSSIAHSLSLPLFPLLPFSDKRDKKHTENVPSLGIYDLISPYNTHKTLSPLLFSDAMMTLLKMRNLSSKEIQKKKEAIETLAKKYEELLKKKQHLDKVWNLLQSLYGTKPVLNKDEAKLFSLDIEPRFFSVLCCADVRGVSQTALAVVEAVKEEKTPNKKSEKKTQPPTYLLEIRKLYWL